MRHSGFLRRLGTGTALAVAALVALPLVAAAILVSPHAVFISARTRSAEVTLANTGTDPEEVTLDLRYGFPTTDSAGGIYVQLFDSIPAGHPAATNWVRAFPRRVVVPPGSRQIVRLVAQPPAGLEDGEYWSRLIVTSRGQRMAVAGGDSAVSAGVTLVVSTIISVSYRTGDLHTQVNLLDFQAQTAGDSLVAWVGLERQGNAAWLGTTWVRLKNTAGAVVREWETPTAVYFATRRRYAWPVADLPRGAYTVELELNTERTDLPRRDILPAPTVIRTVGVELR